MEASRTKLPVGGQMAMLNPKVFYLSIGIYFNSNRYKFSMRSVVLLMRAAQVMYWQFVLKVVILFIKSSSFTDSIARSKVVF